MTVAQVGDALVQLALARGAPAASVAVDGNWLKLSFSTAPGAAILPVLAAHPQVHWIEMDAQGIPRASTPAPSAPQAPTNVRIVDSGG